MTPIETLIEWFNALPVEVKQDTAFLVFGSVPDELVPDSALAEKAPDSKFAERVHRWGRGLPSRHVGAVLMVAGAIDFILLNRGTAEDWAKFRKTMEHVATVATIPELKDLADNNLNKLPERAATWMEATATWRRLRDGELSLSSLHSWMKEQG